MEFLQLVERLDDGRLQHQRLGLLAEGYLLFVVLLQIEVTQLLVDLDEAVKILDVQVVGLPQILDMLLRHDAGILPALLQLAELVERMVERLVRIDQLLQLLDDRLLDLEIRLLLGFEVGDERVAAAAVLLELLLELNFGAVHRRSEILLGAALLDEAAACGLDLGAADAVKGDLQRLHIPADRLHGLLFEHPGEQGHQLLLAFSGELVLLGLLRGEFLRGLLLGRRALDLQPGILRRERSLLIGKVHLHVPGRVLLRFRNLRPGGRLDPGTFGARRSLLPGNPLRGGLLRRRFCGGRFGNPGRRFGGGRLRHGGFRGRVRNLRNGFFRSGGRLRSRSGGGHFGFRDSGSHGRIRLRIFSRRADLLLGSRKCRFFSSHFSTRFLVPAYAEAYKSRKYNHFMRNAEKISSKHATTPPCGSAKSLHPGTAAQFSGLFRPFVSACGPLRQCVWAQPDGPW